MTNTDRSLAFSFALSQPRRKKAQERLSCWRCESEHVKRTAVNSRVVKPARVSRCIDNARKLTGFSCKTSPCSLKKTELPGYSSCKPFIPTRMCSCQWLDNNGLCMLALASVRIRAIAMLPFNPSIRCLSVDSMLIPSSCQSSRKRPGGCREHLPAAES